MNEGNYGHPGNEGPERERVHQARRPYWKGVHRDWRVWVALFFCLAAIAIYVLSDDLSFFPSGIHRQPISDTGGK